MADGARSCRPSGRGGDNARASFPWFRCRWSGRGSWRGGCRCPGPAVGDAGAQASPRGHPVARPAAPGSPPELCRPQLVWEELDSWLTPPEKFFIVSHYGNHQWPGRAPAGTSASGPVAGRPQGSPAPRGDLHAGVLGQHRLPPSSPAASATPAGPAPRSPAAEEAGVLDRAIEVVFWGADGRTIRDNTGARVAGGTGGRPVAADLTITEQFARSMSLDECAETRQPAVLRDERRAAAPKHGFPVRLIAPGWYGGGQRQVADAHRGARQRYQGRFMARDYVTIREEQRDGQTVWTFTSVGPRPAQVGAGQGHPSRAAGTRSWAPPGARRSPRWRSRSTTGRGCRPSSRTPGQGRRAASPGGSGRSTGGRRPRASTHHLAAIDVDGNVQPAPTPVPRQQGGPSGRATGRSPAGWRSRPVDEGCATTYR